MAPSGGGRDDEGIYRGDMWTLDIMGYTGWNILKFRNCPPDTNDWDYDCHFGGTSGACPVVAGVASLLLAYDSTLTRDIVYSILKHSAVTHFDSFYITPPDFYYGYGRVDAFRAILSIARGNIDNDPGKNIDIADLTALIDYLYNTFVPPFPSPLLGDVDCDGTVDMSDLSLLIDHLFVNLTPLNVPCFNYGN
jgi:hypothetical protein